ncbi:MAG TPA: hypothetical protein VHS99_22675 [Chloroflexota bacterium]|nr:hypothetical protein [Chloroflexota bacterium]
MSRDERRAEEEAAGEGTIGSRGTGTSTDGSGGGPRLAEDSAADLEASEDVQREAQAGVSGGQHTRGAASNSLGGTGHGPPTAAQSTGVIPGGASPGYKGRAEEAGQSGQG